jgi:hypothetical protein
MKKIFIAAAVLAALSGNAYAESYGKPCTAAPKDKWMTLEAIEKIVADHGYTVAKAKMKDTCAEVYARDTDGKRIEFFIDPETGNPVGTEWKPAKKGNAS